MTRLPIEGLLAHWRRRYNN